MSLLAAAPSWWWMPANGAAHGAALDRQMVLSLAIVGILMIIVKAILVASALKSSKARAAENSVNFFGVGTLIFLTVVFAWLLIRAERMWASQRFTGASATAMQVEVVGAQFVWYFRYPGADATFGTTRPELVNAAGGNPLGLDARDSHAADDRVTSELVLPVNGEVDLRLRTFDVIHGFFIPGMRVKQNAVPGSTLHIHFTPNLIGEYPIVCSQVCGSGHYRMQARLRVVSEPDYQRWLSERGK